jgi:AcrR family transcriptional regulator
MAAAVHLVSERGTTAIPAAEFAEVADVSRKVLYLHFGDRDGLLVAAAVDLVERDLLTRVDEVGDDLDAQLRVTTHHFAQHRSFYRPMLTGSCAFGMTSALNRLFGSLSAPTVRRSFLGLDARSTDDLAVFFAGGASTVVNDWLINSADPLDPDDMVERLLRISSVLVPAHPDQGGAP